MPNLSKFDANFTLAHFAACAASKSVPKNVKFRRRRTVEDLFPLLSLLAPAPPSPLTQLLSIKGAGRKATGSVEADQDGVRQAAALCHGLSLGPVCLLWKPAWTSESSGKPASCCSGQRSSGSRPTPACCPAADPSSTCSTNDPKIPAEAGNQLGSDSKFRFPLCSHFLPTADQASPSWQERSP